MLDRGWSGWCVLGALALVAGTASVGSPALVTGRGRASECSVVWDTGSAPVDGVRLGCTDGDPACDADGEVDGACTIAVDVCVGQATDGCAPELVQSIVFPGRSGRALGDAGFVAPPTGSATPACGEPARLVLPLRARKRGLRPSKKLKLKMKAATDGGRFRSALVLRCLPPEDGDGGTPASCETEDAGPPAGVPRFAVIGDYGDDDEDTRAVAALVTGWAPDYVLTVGDNDYSDGAFRGSFEGLERGVGQYFHAFIGDYQGSAGPGATDNAFFPTAGDHDWGDRCDDPAGLDDYLRYFTLPGGGSGNERYYDFRRGPIHFFALSSVEDCEPDGTTPDSVQGEWVRQTAAASDAPFKIAYFHHPPWSSGEHRTDGAHMQWPWQAWGFPLVMAGHDHDYERIERDGSTSLVVGLGGVERRGFGRPVEGSLVRFSEAYGALRVEVHDDRLDLRFVTVDGCLVDAFSLDAPG